MTIKEQKIVMSNTCDGQIIRQLLYYDIFDHPLSQEELFIDCSLDKDTYVGFNELLKKRLIFKLDSYYSVRNEPHLSIRRLKGEENTRIAMPKALKMAKLISRFPFVRAVALSGSISKGYMDSTTDVDYFIITKPKFLWLSRTMLILYKKIFLLNSFRFFCLNYFIDEDNLEIPDRNRFAATELNTLIPVYGNDLLNTFFKENNWVSDYYKGYSQKTADKNKDTRRMPIKKLMEFTLSNFIGKMIDSFCMKLTVKFWRLKYKGERSSLFQSSFRLNRGVAKYHPGNFQDSVLDKFNENIESFKETESQAK